MFHGSTVIFSLLCLGGAAAYVLVNAMASPAREPILAKALTKAIASTSFVALPLQNGAPATDYGRAILVALVLSWFGDMLLLSRQPTYLLSGIAAFLLAHIAFIGAFAMREFNWAVVTASLVVTGLLAVLILNWLWKYLIGIFVVAVPAYLAVIMLMVSMAVGGSITSLPTIVAIAAVLFAASDISVARDRFVERDLINKAWGLPLYYLAQLLFAGSVATVA